MQLASQGYFVILILLRGAYANAFAPLRGAGFFIGMLRQVNLPRRVTS
jgi:hypothetical protein